MPRKSVVNTLRTAFSMKASLETAPVEAVNAAISCRSAEAGRAYSTIRSWDRGTNRGNAYTQMSSY